MKTQRPDENRVSKAQEMNDEKVESSESNVTRKAAETKESKQECGREVGDTITVRRKRLQHVTVKMGEGDRDGRQRRPRTSVVGLEESNGNKCSKGVEKTFVRERRELYVE